MGRKRVDVTRETESGRNERGEYPDYHVRRIGGVPTPASNPDGNKGNNLD